MGQWCKACMQCTAPSGHASNSCLAAAGSSRDTSHNLAAWKPACCMQTNTRGLRRFLHLQIVARAAPCLVRMQVPRTWGCLFWAPWCAERARAQHILLLLTTSRCISPLMSMASKLSQEQGMRGKSTSNCSSNRVGSHGQHQLLCWLSAWRCAGLQHSTHASSMPRAVPRHMLGVAVRSRCVLSPS
jgi:hypothetical protein